MKIAARSASTTARPAEQRNVLALMLVGARHDEAVEAALLELGA
jgi:hypothetical protein